MDTIKIEEAQFERLLKALTSDEKRLSAMTDHLNSEVIARARAVNEVRAELAATNLEVATIRRALHQLVEALDQEGAE